MLYTGLFGRPREAYDLKGFHHSYDKWEEQPLSLPDARRKKLLAHCRELLAGKDDSEKGFAASVLLTKEVGWAELTEAELKELFLSSHPSAWPETDQGRSTMDGHRSAGHGRGRTGLSGAELAAPTAAGADPASGARR